MEDFSKFKELWLSDIEEAKSTTDKGKRFIDKMISDWLDPTEAMLAESEYCDGPNDGGIDFAILIEGDDQNNENESNEASGNTWYVIQSKYGTSYSGTSTLWDEAMKFFRTLTGNAINLSEPSKKIQNKLHIFIKGAHPGRDKLIFTFALVKDLTEQEAEVIGRIREYGRDLLAGTFNTNPAIFDVAVVSINTIYNRNIEETDFSVSTQLAGNLIKANDILLIGSTSIVDYYRFLKDYRDKTNDLEHIFEKNVRQSLGGQVKVNKGIRNTLESKPEMFGLYNNGITIAVTDFSLINNRWLLTDPYVVNGCQTSSSIWAVCDGYLSTGARTKPDEVVQWEQRADQSHVMVKIVKVGKEGGSLLRDITTYTNSQNAVRDRDFIALSDSFQGWKNKLKSKWKLYLEIQKGGWEAEKTKGIGRKKGPEYRSHANAIELMKAYGAGWLEIPGVAYGKNAPFAPGGWVYKQVTRPDSEFNENDLYAAHLLLKSADSLGFGRASERESYRQTKYLYCFLTIHLLRVALDFCNRRYDNKSISRIIVEYSSIHGNITTGACEIIEKYMRKNGQNCIENEKGWNRSVNNYLKAESFGRDLQSSEHLNNLISGTIREFKGNGFFRSAVDEM